jgi:hypothetical protein
MHWEMACRPAHLIGQANANSQEEAPNDQHRHIYSPSLHNTFHSNMHHCPSWAQHELYRAANNRKLGVIRKSWQGWM